MPECSVVLAHECSSWVHTSANNASEQNATGGGYAWGFCAKGCLLSLLCLIVKIYMGDASWVMCLL